MTNITLNVEGMSCGHCANSVEGAVKKLGASGKVNLSAKTVTVDFDEQRINLGQIKQAIEDQGYDVV